MRTTLLAVALAVLGTGRASAQERVVEEEIVLQDPTVASGGNWTVGGSFEGWYMNTPYELTDQNGNAAGTGYITGSVPGGNVFIGYGDWTLQGSYRSGSFNYKENFTFRTFNYRSEGVRKQDEVEVTLRYLWKWKKHFNPYALVGYHRSKIGIEERLTAPPNTVWAYNGRPVYKDETTFNSGELGVGAVIPFNKYVGMRTDMRAMLVAGRQVRDDGHVDTGSGPGATVTGTGYLNLFRGLNLQAGLKGQYLSAGEKVPDYGTLGLFISAGYSYKF